MCGCVFFTLIVIFGHVSIAPSLFPLNNWSLLRSSLLLLSFSNPYNHFCFIIHTNFSLSDFYKSYSIISASTQPNMNSLIIYIPTCFISGTPIPELNKLTLLRQLSQIGQKEINNPITTLYPLKYSAYKTT